MSKILLVGDIHLGMSYPNNYQKWLNIAQEYFSKFLIPLIKSKLCEEDIVVFLGDLFDNRNFIPIDILDYARVLIEDISNICQIHILVGNHDQFHKSSGDVNSINMFKYMKNVFIYEKTRLIEYNNNKILMMPYIDKRVEQIKELKKHSGCDYLFCHSDLNGAKMHLTSVAHKNLDKIDVDEFTGYNDVRTGHIHIQQKIGNITFVGSVFEMDRNDMNNPKGIFILDTNTGDETFVENKISPKFKKIYIRVEEDISSLDKISTRDYIDLFVSNSLLVNNRKLRRKLEIILETGNFASVEYLDDINKTDSDDEDDIKESVVNEALDNNQIHDIKLEYKEVIREYISSLTYNSDKTKSGILSEYNEIVRIYDDGYDKKKRK